MNVRRAVPALVTGLGTALVATGIVTFAMGDPPDYADLVPAPDAIVWHVGQDSTFFVSTNREDVDMRINSVALGIANVQGAVPHSGALMVLGASVGCQDWAVSRLTADAISTSGFTVKGLIDRDNFTSTATVYYRMRVEGETVWGGAFQVDVTYDANDLAASNRFQASHSVDKHVWEIEASSDSSFPTALTRFITVDMTAAIGTATIDEEAETLLMLPDTGVGLRACSEHEDVAVSLHGEDGAQLNRYEFDIGPVATATPEPTATPSPNAGYEERAVCVDDGSSRGAYLTGSEYVGAAFDHDDFDLNSLATVVIGDVPGSEGNRYFFEISASHRVTVSDAGAANTQGLDSELVYPIRLTATDDDGRMKYLDVGVWLDTANLSSGDNGIC